jgi:putative copper resistance protein D
MLPPLFNAAILWIHLFSAILFVGGSFFIWLVVLPASHLIAKDESERMQIVEKIARQFGRITGPTLIVLVLSGVYNASWYLPSTSALFDTYLGNLLLVKIVLVILLVALIYVHGLYFGRKIVRLAREGKLGELNAVRKQSRIVSAANLVLMMAILALAIFLQIPP